MKFHTKRLHHIILHNIVANSLLMNEMLFPNTPAMFFFLPQLTRKVFYIVFFPSQNLTKDLMLCLFVISQGSCKLGHWSEYPFSFCQFVKPLNQLS